MTAPRDAAPRRRPSEELPSPESPSRINENKRWEEGGEVSDEQLE